jgi:hypothetical protein
MKTVGQHPAGGNPVYSTFNHVLSSALDEATAQTEYHTELLRFHQEQLRFHLRQALEWTERKRELQRQIPVVWVEQAEAQDANR